MYVCMYVRSSHGFELLLLDKFVIFQICVEVVASVEEVPLPLLLCLVWIAHIMYVLYASGKYLLYTCMYARIYVCMYYDVCIYVSVWTYARVLVCMHMYIGINMYMYVEVR